MTQQVFADYIGQSPATLSSIFNGRTRPTINIVEAIKKKIPNISTDWLMFGAGDMYLSSSTPSEGMAESIKGVQESILVFDSPVIPASSNAPSVSQNYNGVRNTRQEISYDEVKIVDKPQRKIMEIRVFYDDQTYDTFVPAKK